LPLEPVHNERDLLLQVAMGSEKAFAELFHAYHPALGEFVLQLTDSREQTEEIIQDVFVKIWTDRQDTARIVNFTAYLFILTRNYTLNRIRKLVNERKRQQQYEAYEATVSQSTIDSHLEEQRLSLIDKAVILLPPQQQKVYLLSRREGLKYVEIAKEMDISKETVKKYLQLANQSITQFVKEHGEVMVILLAVDRWLR
jgi:RNA polymerase sigma-70 factor (ECF subfamily)